MIMSKSNELKIHKKLADKYKAISKESFYLVYQNYWNNILLEGVSKDCNSLVLDCGCGIGRMLNFLCHRYNYVYGMDLSKDMLKVAYQDQENIKRGNIKLVISDMQQIGLKNESFDIVICKSSLHHLPEINKTIKEIYRILKKGGTLVISEPCRDNIIWRKIGLIYVKLSRRFSSHHRIFDSKALKEIMTQNGFKIKKIQHFGFIAFPLCAIAHLFPLMKFVLFNLFFAKILIKIDEKVIKIPLIKKFYWHIIIHSKKI